jgi:hypothetical protein
LDARKPFLGELDVVPIQLNADVLATVFEGDCGETNGGQERGYHPGKAAVDECVSSDRLRTEGGRPN